MKVPMRLRATTFVAVGMVCCAVSALSPALRQSAAATVSSPRAYSALSETAMSVFSPPPRQGMSNGASDHTAFSQDNRDVRIVAFDSGASNLVAGDHNGKRDVFALLKARGAGRLGGELVELSVDSHGHPGNGESAYPTVDGTTGAIPHCVAFESTATNLAPGAGSNDKSIYLRDVKARKTLLVSTGSSLANDPSIDGHCSAVAYHSRGWVIVRDLLSRQLLRVSPGENPDLETDGRGVAFDEDGQVYLQRLLRRRGMLQPDGHKILVSSTVGKKPGNGVSSNPAVDDHGEHVAFQTTATDLCVNRCPQADPTVPGWDINGPLSDVLLRALPRRSEELNGAEMQLVSGKSLARDGGASVNPAISRAGRQVAFESTGNNGRLELGSGSNVFSWYWPSHQRFTTIRVVSGALPWVLPDSIFNGPSGHPSISSRGNYVAFTSWESGRDGERNGSQIPDVFMRFMGLNHEGLPTE
jgi:hypothetical protein